MRSVQGPASSILNISTISGPEKKVLYTKSYMISREEYNNGFFVGEEVGEHNFLL